MTSDQDRNEPRIEPRFDDGGDGGFEVDPYDRPAPDPRRVMRRRILGAVVALAALGGFAGIAWYATSEGHRNPAAVVPVLSADKTPIKERPAEPGGLKIPNRNMQVFNEINPDSKPQKVEQLLPPPEAPVARPKGEAKSAPPKGPLVPQAPAIESRSAGEATTPAAPAAKAPQAKTVAEAPVRAPSAPAKTEAAQKAPVKAPSATRTAMAKSGAWSIQLGAVHEEARAKAALARIVKANGDILGNMPSQVVRVDLGKKGIYYRMRAGAFADRTAAAAVCHKLAARKVGCIPVKS